MVKNGGPLGGPTYRIMFGRNQDVIQLECFARRDPMTAESQNESADELKVGGGGCDLRAAQIIESFLGQFYINEFDDESENEVIDGNTTVVRINLPHYHIAVSWYQDCPSQLKPIEGIVDAIWAWSEKHYRNKGWVD